MLYGSRPNRYLGPYGPASFIVGLIIGLFVLIMGFILTISFSLIRYAWHEVSRLRRRRVVTHPTRDDLNRYTAIP